jgi:aspartate/methionine/tyrosine aminotransferase
LIPLWFGESDQPTPPFIRSAAKDALDEGLTFYQPNAGILPLRQAISRYMNDLYDTRFRSDNIIVTGSGMLGISLAGQCVVAPGDTLVTHAPTWPNLPSVQQILGAKVNRVPLSLQGDQWMLDLDRLFDACDSSTRALLINSPGNPTGWMMSDTDQQAVLDFCRQRGLWLIADEVYNRIVYDRPCAPTFADKIVPDEDRVLIINSFSKAWAMTGWRLGWITAPASLLRTFEMLTEFNNSCNFAPVQIAGIAALEQGEAFIQQSLARYQAARTVLVERFAQLPRVFLPRPDAAFYAFFAVEGVADSVAFAEQVLEEANVGLAPGLAFGPEGEGYQRLCYAVEPDLLDRALERITPLLS